MTATIHVRSRNPLASRYIRENGEKRFPPDGLSLLHRAPHPWSPGASNDTLETTRALKSYFLDLYGLYARMETSEVAHQILSAVADMAKMSAGDKEVPQH